MGEQATIKGGKCRGALVFPGGQKVTFEVDSWEVNGEVVARVPAEAKVPRTWRQFLRGLEQQSRRKL